MKLVTASEMRELDRRAIQDLGIPSLVLMENAGRTTYQILRREFPDLQGEVAVVAGRGNNGGDGFVVARYLANAGIPVAVFLLGPRDQVSGDARVNLEILAHLGVEVAEVLTDADLNPTIHRLAKAGLIVDALLGTGLNSPVQGLMAALIERINHLRPPVLAVDIPTGLSADTGEVLGVALKAQVTVTYGWPKLGQVLPPGRDYVGRLWQVDIGIPPQFAQEAPVELAEAREMRALLPPRPFGSHKGHLRPSFGPGRLRRQDRGRGPGCRGGPPGRGRAGDPGDSRQPQRHPGSEAHRGHDPALARGGGGPGPGRGGPGAHRGVPGREKFDTVALGPGIGTHPETRELVGRLVRDLACPMVIDADGVNDLAGDPSGLKDAAGPRILTPHPGEMARLVGLSTPEVQARRLDLARETAAKFGVTLVLKGAQTVVAAPDGRASLNSTGNPALASGGTGDVLTGLIGGFLAQGLAPWDAARLGVYLHGLAADFFVGHHGPRGMIAGDLLAVLPQMLTEFSQGLIPLAEEDICFTARDIMTTEVLTVSPETLIADLSKTLENRKIGGVPVVDQGGRLVGVITQSDLVERARDLELPPAINILDFHFYLEIPSHLLPGGKDAGHHGGRLYEPQPGHGGPGHPGSPDRRAHGQTEDAHHSGAQGGQNRGVIGKMDLVRAWPGNPASEARGGASHCRKIPPTPLYKRGVYLKSPFCKGGFRGISLPPLTRGEKAGFTCE